MFKFGFYPPAAATEEEEERHPNLHAINDAAKPCGVGSAGDQHATHAAQRVFGENERKQIYCKRGAMCGSMSRFGWDSALLLSRWLCVLGSVNVQDERFVRHMNRIPSVQARPDLVGQVYHVSLLVRRGSLTNTRERAGSAQLSTRSAPNVLRCALVLFIQ